MTTKPRLSTNVINGLEEAMANIQDMWGPLDDAIRITKARHLDPVLAVDLAALASGLAAVEHYIRNARAGKFEARRPQRGGV